jgi:hypothetical protein
VLIGQQFDDPKDFSACIWLMIFLEIFLELFEFAFVIDDVGGVIPFTRCEFAKDASSTILDLISIAIARRVRI